MNDVWNLDPIYLGFDDPAFDRDLKELKEAVAEFAAWTENLADCEPFEGLKEGIARQEKLMTLGGKLVEYAMLRQAADTMDPEAGSRVGQIMAALSSIAAPQAAFQAWASQLPDLMELVAKDAVLSEFTFLFANMKESSRFLLPGRGEEIAAKLGLSGGNAWSEMQQYLTSTVPVTYRGEKTNLSAIRNMAYDPDAAVRRDAYEAELHCYERIADPVAYALNSIKLETITDCELRGYEGPLDRTLKEAHMSKATLEAMLGAMDEYLPKFWQYLKAKA